MSRKSRSPDTTGCISAIKAICETELFQKESRVQAKGNSASSTSLKGWTAIARYLGIPVATVHRWASEGMPVRRGGRSTVADREAVSAWLGRESHMPAPTHVMTDNADLTARSKSRLRGRGSGNKKPNLTTSAQI